MSTLVLSNEEPLAPVLPSDFEAPVLLSPKPWFLKTEDIYEVVKHAAADVKYGDIVLAERAISVVDGFAIAISKNVLRISETEGLSIVKKMDELTTSVLKSVDNGVDILRVKLAEVKLVEAIEKLQAAVLVHVQWTSENVKAAALEAQKHCISVKDQVVVAYQNSENVKAVKDRLEPLAVTVSSTYVSVEERVKQYLARVSTEYPEAVATFKQYIVLPHPDMLTASSILTNVREKAAAVYNNATPVASAFYTRALPVVTSFLDTAQPYVHKAIDLSSPYVNRALEISKPVVDIAVDYSQPMINKATEAAQPYVNSDQAKLILEHPVLQATISHTQCAVEAVKEYCTANKAIEVCNNCGDVTVVQAVEECPSSGTVADAKAARAASPVRAPVSGADNSAAPVYAALTAAVVVSDTTVGHDDVSPPAEVKHALVDPIIAAPVAVVEDTVAAAPEVGAGPETGEGGGPGVGTEPPLHAAVEGLSTADNPPVEASPGTTKPKGKNNRKK